MIPMIATRTMSMMVTIALLGVVPVVAHAQQVVDLGQLVSQSGTAKQSSEPGQAQIPQIYDQDKNINTATNTPINFAVVAVGPFNAGTASSDSDLATSQTFKASDEDTNTIIGEQTQDAPVTQNLGQGLSNEQNPEFPVSSVNDILALALPGT
jgi:hypothetical protein